MLNRKKQLVFFFLCLFSFLPLPLQAAYRENNDFHREKLLRIFSGEWVSRSIYTAVKLGIPDLLESTPLGIEELSERTSCHPESLLRLLRTLKEHGIFRETSSGIFSNSPTGSLLTRDHPDSLRSLCLFYGEEIHRSWDMFPSSVQSGSPAFDLSFHQPVFIYLKNYPDRAALFQAAMREKSQAVIQSALSAYSFGSFQNLYDIGGGQGQFLKAVTEKYPGINATLFELPEVVRNLSEKIPGIRVTAGDFFQEVPKGGDLYILKSVLHDWNDQEAENILRNCAEAMNEDGRLLIVEVVLQSETPSLFANDMDLLMMAITGGKERSLQSFENLLKNSGLSLEKIHPTTTEFSILEVKKAK